MNTTELPLMQRPPEGRMPLMPVSSRRRLRVLATRDGRVRLVDSKGATFAPCATAAIAERLRAVYAP